MVKQNVIFFCIPICKVWDCATQPDPGAWAARALQWLLLRRIYLPFLSMVYSLLAKYGQFFLFVYLSATYTFFSGQFVLKAIR
jgi:hypothetical protein